MSVTLRVDMHEPKLKPRTDIHLARKVWHFFGVIAIMVIYHNVTRPVALQLLMLLGSFVIFVDLLRQRVDWLNRFAVRAVGPLMRDSEEKSLTGASFLMIGVFICVALFPTNVVKLSLLFLAVADPLASYFGVRYGRDKIFGNKSLQGSAAAFLACTLVSGGYYLSQDLMVERLVVVSLLSGFIGAVSEAVPVGKLDDNLVLPVLSSGLLFGLFRLFGGF